MIDGSIIGRQRRLTTQMGGSSEDDRRVSNLLVPFAVADEDDDRV